MFPIYAAFFLSTVNLTSIKILLPEIMIDLGIGMNWLTWLVNAYSLPLAALIPVAGRFGDIYGPRKLFQIGVLGLGLGSFLCGTAISVSWLIIGRITQALGAALLAPNSLAILLESATIENQGQILGTWNAISAFGAVIGPVFSGMLVEAFSWKSSYIIIAGLALVIAFTARNLGMQEERSGHKCRETETGLVDYKGSFSLMCAVTFFLLSLTLLPDWGWQNIWIKAGFGLFLIFVYIFYRVEKTIKDPLLDLRLLSVPFFSLGLLVSFIEQLVMAGTLFVLPIYFSTVKGFTASQTALFLAPCALSMALCMPLGGKLSDRFGPGPPIVAGMILRTISFLFLALVVVGTPYHYIALYLILNGIGYSLSSTPALNAVISTVTADRHASTSGVYNMVRYTSAAAGTTLAGIILYTLIPSSFTSITTAIPGFKEYYLFGAAACLPGIAAGIALWKQKYI